MNLPEIIRHCELLAMNVGDGREDALSAFAELRAVIAAAQDALREVEPSALTEAERYGEKSFVHAGLKFTRTDGKRIYRYDHLQDWVDARATLATIEERAKQAALMAEKGMAVAEGADGVLVEAAIVTFGKASLQIAKP